jgi:hypothetical protein
MSEIVEMRARLQKYLPIFLLALIVQIIAPIGASWAAALDASDPLSVAEICRSNILTADGSADQSGHHSAHDGACSVCCLAGASSHTDTPALAILAVPNRALTRVVWCDRELDLSSRNAGSNAQARAPPFSS